MARRVNIQSIMQKNHYYVHFANSTMRQYTAATGE